ncbi:hypothetical protein FRC10_002645, partial [Ceratobasidium sp. 414]
MGRKDGEEGNDKGEYKYESKSLQTYQPNDKNCHNPDADVEMEGENGPGQGEGVNNDGPAEEELIVASMYEEEGKGDDA